MKAEDAKTPGAGIIPKLCPRKCVVEMEHGSNRPIGVRGRPELGCGVRDLLDASARWTRNETEPNEMGTRFAPSRRFAPRTDRIIPEH